MHISRHIRLSLLFRVTNADKPRHPLEWHFSGSVSGQQPARCADSSEDVRRVKRNSISSKALALMQQLQPRPGESRCHRGLLKIQPNMSDVHFDFLYYYYYLFLFIFFTFFDSHSLRKPSSQLTAPPSITRHWFVPPKQIAIKRPDAAEFIIIVSSYLSSTFQNQSYRVLYKDSKRNENIKHPGHKIRSQGGKIKAVTTILRCGDSFLKNSKPFIEIQWSEINLYTEIQVQVKRRLAS